jgi:histidinol-phosphate aminotransferase
MFDINVIIRQNIHKLQPYSSAREEYAGNASIWLDANENPMESGLNRYPDPLQKEVKDAISSLKNIHPDQIFLGNGSDEAIDLLIRLFCEPGKDKILLLPPTYSMYRVCADIHAIQSIEVPLIPGFQIDSKRAGRLLSDEHLKLIFINSPNNPTGNLMDKEIIRRIALNFRGIVTVDEAYIDFAPEGSMLQMINEIPNLVVLQTFSKAWGMAGIRLGIAFANRKIIDNLNKIKLPYNVNILTQKAILEKLRAPDGLGESVGEILKQREFMRCALSRSKHVVKIYPSDANFLLVQFTNPLEVYNHLSKKGIIVRNRTSAVKDCLRITVGNSFENKTLIDELKHLK